MTTSSMTTPTAEAPSGTLGGERKGWVEQVALVVFIGVPFVAVLSRSRSPGAAGSAGPTCCSRRLLRGRPATASRSASTATSPTARSRPSGRCGSRSRSPAAWRSRARSPAGWPTTAGTTRSPTRRATRTRRGATARPCPALSKGLWHAHIGWLFDVEQTAQQHYAPDLLKDHDIVRVTAPFPCRSRSCRSLLPAVLGGLLTWSWQGALTAFFWASLVRIGLLHHVTWSINSICHAFGERPFVTRDKSGNVWWLAVLSMGESWHNLHHADPTCARHGVLRGQLDSSARLIRCSRSFGWASDVRWPKPERLDARRAA